MGFNSDYLRGRRQAANAQARSRRAYESNLLPSIRTSALVDGTYLVRLWPEDAIKNPLGYLHYRTHTIGDRTIQCPRSNNWDPLPMHFVDDLGVAHDEPGDGLTPVYEHRCAACETDTQLAEAGIDVSTLSAELQTFLCGPVNEWGRRQGGLLGEEAFHFPCTIRAVVVERETRRRQDGSTYEKLMFGPAAPGSADLYHCDLTLNPGRILDTLLNILEECPNCNNLMAGRWIVLTKKNGGIGAGGYDIRLKPNASPAGFELPQNYPDYSKWGKGGRDKPTKRLSYADQEVLLADPKQPWYRPLRELGIVLSDDDADLTPVARQLLSTATNRFNVVTDNDIPF